MDSKVAQQFDQIGRPLSLAKSAMTFSLDRSDLIIKAKFTFSTVKRKGYRVSGETNNH